MPPTLLLLHEINSLINNINGKDAIGFILEMVSVDLEYLWNGEAIKNLKHIICILKLIAFM